MALESSTPAAPRLAVAMAVAAIVLAVFLWLSARQAPYPDGSFSVPEDFASVREKARLSVNYFQQSGGQPSYSEYRDRLQEQSNNYEYYELARLYSGGNLDVETASKVLR